MTDGGQVRLPTLCSCLILVQNFKSQTVEVITVPIIATANFSKITTSNLILRGVFELMVTL